MFFGQILLNSLVLGTQVLLLAIPLYLVHAVSKIYHLALGTIGVAAAYGLYFGVSRGYPWWLSVAVALAVALMLSWISYRLLEESARKGERLFALLLSLALIIILESLIAFVFQTDAKSIIEGVLPTLSVGALYLTLPGAVTLAVGALFAPLSVLLLKKSGWGRKVRGVAENTSVTSSLSINPSRIRLGVYLLAGIMAAFVSTMTAMNTALTPRSGFTMIILSFVAMIMGGVSDLKGLILSSFLVTLIPQLILNATPARFGVSGNWDMVIVFAVATAALLWRPQGLFSNAARHN